MPSNRTAQLETLVSLGEQLDRFGDRPAVIRFAREGSDTWSYSRLSEESGRLAGGLHEGGVETGEKIAIIAEPSPEWFVAGLAILRVGAVLVPIDTQMPDRDLARVLKDSGVRRLFATTRLAHRVAQLEGKEKLDVLLLNEPDKRAKERGYKTWQSLCSARPASPASVTETNEAVLFYTSGTTGPPKGVPLTHRNILFQIKAIEKSGLVQADDRLLLPLPMHHVYPLVIGLLTPLGLGVTIVLPHALTGESLVRALRDGGATVILGVPRLYRALYEGIRAKAGGAGRVAAWLFSGAIGLARASQRIRLPLGRLLFRPIRNKMGPRLRMLASGGSPLDPELARNLEALGWPIAVGYGLTETSPLLTLKRPGEGNFSTVGRAIEGIELKVDPSGLPEGERTAQEAGKSRHRRGEVLARGPSVFNGYHNLPEKTEKDLEDGWFRTGDLGYLDNKGYLYLGGRASSMIVLEGGENINPEELEAFYAEADEVDEIGILEDNGKLAALVVPARSLLRDHDPDEARKVAGKALENRASALASYKRLSHIEATRRSLPTTRLGKIKRHVLEERYQAAKKGEGAKEKETGPVPIEELSSEERTLLDDPAVKKLWNLLAKRYPDRRLTPEANLELDLGIDSLEWVELSLSVQEHTGIPITEDLIERVDTVRDLLEEAAGAATREDEGRRPIEEPEKVLQREDRRWVSPRNRVQAGIAAVFYGLLRATVGLRCRIEARGIENLPERGPFLLVPNHVSYLDAPALTLGLGYWRAKRLFWAGNAEILFRNFVRRSVSRIFQAVPIDPHRGPLSSLAASALLVKQGQPLVWFPEGRISTDGKLQNFQPGIGLIIDYYEPPVVPVFIDGTRERLPPGKKWPGSGRITITFGEPVATAKLRAEADKIEEGPVHERIAAALQNAVAELGKQASRERAGRKRRNNRQAA